MLYIAHRLSDFLGPRPLSHCSRSRLLDDVGVKARSITGQLRRILIPLPIQYTRPFRLPSRLWYCRMLLPISLVESAQVALTKTAATATWAMEKYAARSQTPAKIPTMLMSVLAVRTPKHLHISLARRQFYHCL